MLKNNNEIDLSMIKFLVVVKTVARGGMSTMSANSAAIANMSAAMSGLGVNTPRGYAPSRGMSPKRKIDETDSSLSHSITMRSNSPRVILPCLYFLILQ